jgi:hypothetical protein
MSTGVNRYIVGKKDQNIINVVKDCPHAQVSLSFLKQITTPGSFSVASSKFTGAYTTRDLL